MNTTAYTQDGDNGRALLGRQRADRARQFRAARRHSRFVRLLRISVPLGIVLIGAGYMLSGWLEPLKMVARLPISLKDVVINGTKIKMEAPRIAGFTKESRPYDLTAHEAVQDLTRPGIVELQGVKAKIEMEDASKVDITAREGLYDTKSELLTLDHDIVVKSSNGSEGFLEQAVIETQSGNIKSNKPVLFRSETGTVRGNRFEARDSGAVLHFDGGVVVNFKSAQPPQTPGPAEQAAEK